MMASLDGSAQSQKFQIFRTTENKSDAEVAVMYGEPLPPIAAMHWPKLREAGYDDGCEVKLLFQAPGLSLNYVWFKSGLPLPRHSHSADCVYYILSGTLLIGSEKLGAGDGFFVGEDVPYAYVPGDQGVELLEFRNSNRFNIRFLAENPAFWAKGVAEITRRRCGWATEARPSERQYGVDA